MLPLRGSVDFATEGETLSAQAGNIVFLPKHCRYEAIFLNEVEDYLVSFETDGPEISARAPIKLSETASFSCTERFRALVAEYFSEHHTK